MPNPQSVYPELIYGCGLWRFEMHESSEEVVLDGLRFGCCCICTWSHFEGILWAKVT